MISTAIGSERRSRVSGYKINKGDFSESTPNLPQQILVIGVPNTDNVSAVSTNRLVEVTSASEAGKIYGYGSPIHQAMKVLRPSDSDGVGGIPTFVLALTNTGAAKVTEITVTGTASAGTVHYLVLNGKPYFFNINQGDTANVIATKISDLNNSIVSSPFKSASATGKVTFTAKFKGTVSNGNTATISNESNPVGITYAETDSTVGSGQSSLANLKNALGGKWITTIVNTEDEKNFKDLEDINGVPYLESPTGRYSPIVFKPFMAFTGFSSDDLNDYNTLAGSNQYGQVTNVVCPAPGSSSTVAEIAASYVRLFCRRMQDNPELDVNGMALPDISVSNNEGFEMFSDYNVRDNLMKKGISTVTYENSQFIIQDLVTTYQFDDEDPLQFNYARNINLDWNVKDAYYIYERRELRDKVLIQDDQVTTSTGGIKMKEWKSVLGTLFEYLAEIALITEPDFSKNSLRVERDSINKNRVNTFFRYKRTGIARIQSTDVEAGF